jgi:hypothetical protein
MLPLNAEFKRSIAYRITKEGHLALHLAGVSGSSARSRRTPEEQAGEFRVLDYLAGQELVPGEAASVSEGNLRAATRVSKLILSGMVRKRWLVREDVSAVQDATRTIKIALLKSAEGKFNDNQRRLVDTLAASGGRVPVDALQALEVPRTTLSTLVKRGLIEIVEESAAFAVSRSVRLWNFISILRSRLLWAVCVRPLMRESFQASCCTVSLVRAKPLSILRVCALCLKRDGRLFSSSLKLALRPRLPPICIRSSAMKLPFCTLPFPTKSARSNGTESRAETRAWLSARALRCSHRSPTSR